ncbi:putative membrane protein [Escherichia coli DEC8D]|nr:putative membrane protein [Escherichia coli DEC8D]
MIYRLFIFFSIIYKGGVLLCNVIGFIHCFLVYECSQKK